ncbi:unnamed protein product [Schistosoma mattheei]|uniref:Uncharacterized protein n=1 Tax=Schistosoma mattheei TaxID=31246 RepID=A0A183NNP1_9TREM|nr:unnamed protein product [Schistosoma mattheei]
MLTSSGSGKSSHLKVRQHAHGTKHLMSSFSGTTISSSTEYYGGGGKDNSSIASPSNVCSDSEDDGHSHSGLSITANTSHHNISPINTNQQLDLNCLSSTGHHNHPTSSPSLSSVPKSVTDVHISSAKSCECFFTHVCFYISPSYYKLFGLSFVVNFMQYYGVLFQ